MVQVRSKLWQFFQKDRLERTGEQGDGCLGTLTFFRTEKNALCRRAKCCFYKSGICQSIGSCPCCSKIRFVLEKGLLPKKPRWADSGLGWGAFKIKCFDVSMSACFAWADAPHNMYTTGLSFSFNSSITRLVKFSQPFPRWDWGWPCRTVSTVFRRSTPCFAQWTRCP